MSAEASARWTPDLSNEWHAKPVILAPDPNIYSGSESKRLVATFVKPEERDACILAIHLLPKVTAERDELLETRREYIIEVKDLHASWLKTSRERDALSALVKELTEGLRRAEQYISNGIEFGYIRLPQADDSARETLPLIRALIGKEPSK